MKMMVGSCLFFVGGEVTRKVRLGKREEREKREETECRKEKRKREGGEGGERERE